MSSVTENSINEFISLNLLWQHSRRDDENGNLFVYGGIRKAARLNVK